MRRRAPRSAALALMLASVVARPAVAESFVLSVADTVGCTRQSSLIGEIAARTQAAQYDATNGHFRFSVQIDRQPNGIVGTLRITSPQGSSTRRSVDGEECREVTSALALIMALTLDPQLMPPASQQTGSQVPAAAGLEANGIAGAAPAAIPSAARAPEAMPPHAGTPVPASPVAQTAAPSRQSGAPRATASHPWQLGMGADVQWISLLARSGGMGLLGVHTEVRQPKALFVRVIGSIGPRVVRDDDQGHAATSTYLGASVELGVPMVPARSAGVDVMVAAWAGRLGAAGLTEGRLVASRTANLAWLGIGPGLRLLWLGKAASLEFLAALPITVVRPQFVFEQTGSAERLFFEAPPVGIQLGLSGTWQLIRE